jgi:hypothetical protein
MKCLKTEMLWTQELMLASGLQEAGRMERQLMFADSDVCFTV